MNALMYMFLLFILAIIFYYIIPYLVKEMLRKRFIYTVYQTPYVYLTFDDGPDPETTPEILNILESFNVKATFFLVGNKVKNYPLLAKRIIQQGHAIGNHSYKHSHAWKSGPIQTILDLVKGHQAMEHFAKHNQILFRPPYGKFNIMTLLYIICWNRKVMFWTLDPKDYNQCSESKIIDYILQRIQPGSVILLHDSYFNNHKNAHTTVKSLHSILSYFKQNNIPCNTLYNAFAPNNTKFLQMDYL